MDTPVGSISLSNTKKKSGHNKAESKQRSVCVKPKIQKLEQTTGKGLDRNIFTRSLSFEMYKIWKINNKY